MNSKSVIGVQDLWAYLPSKCPEACQKSNLNLVAKKVAEDARRSATGVYYAGQSAVPLQLVLDVDSCLHRLYGGYYNDWVCGGGWNRLTTFIQELTSSLQQANIMLVPIFNGSFELGRIHDWHKTELAARERINHIFHHLEHASSSQWKPPPKVWWNAPICSEIALRLAFRTLGLQTVCTTEDHKREIIDYCREHKFHGVMGDAGDYLVFQPPRLFSAASLKLCYSGRIETIEYNIDLAARSMDIHPTRLTLLSALLGNHLLTSNDLHEFYCQLLDRNPLDTHVKIKVDEVIEVVLGFVRRLESTEPKTVANIIFRNYASNVKGDLCEKLVESVMYYFNGTQEGFEKFRPKLKAPAERLPGSYPSTSNGTDSNDSGINTSKGDKSNGELLSAMARLTLKDDEVNAAALLTLTPSVHKTPELAFFAKHGVPASVMRETSERHHKGLMHPWIYQVLSEGHIKIPIGLEREGAYPLPLAVDIYRPIRRHVYGVLFGDQSAVVNEWVVRKMGLQCEQVKAVPLEMETPISCHDLWFSRTDDSNEQRGRALLSCMGITGDSSMMDPNKVAPGRLVVCCVIRYLVLQRVLCPFEMNALLAQMLHPALHNVDLVMEMELDYINVRAVQLGSLFMRGVEHFIMANDACGAFVPWNYTAPWMFFDGKLFQKVYQQLQKGETIMDALGHHMSAYMEHENLRIAICEGLTKLEFAPPSVAELPSEAAARRVQHNMPYRGPAPNTDQRRGPGGPFPASKYVGMRSNPTGDPGLSTRNDHHAMGRPGVPNTGVTSGLGRGRGIAGGPPVNNTGRVEPGRSLDYRGGHLEVGGITVSNWGPNTHAATRGRGRGRGTRGGDLEEGSHPPPSLPGRGFRPPMAPIGYFPGGMPVDNNQFRGRGRGSAPFSQSWGQHQRPVSGMHRAGPPRGGMVKRNVYSAGPPGNKDKASLIKKPRMHFDGPPRDDMFRGSYS